MDVSVVEQVGVKCGSCGHAQASLRWVVVDLTARPDFRSLLQDSATYESACEACGFRAPRDTSLFVVGLATEAPIVLACPDRLLRVRAYTAGSETVIEQTRHALRQQRRAVPGPLLPVPFDVLAAVAGRDIDTDIDQRETATREVEAQAGRKTRERYERFLGYVSDSHASRWFEVAFERLFVATDAEELASALRIGGPTFVVDARARCSEMRDAASEAGDQFGVGITSAQLELLDKCAEGELEERVVRYLESMSALQHRFHAVEFEPLRCAVDHAESPDEAVAACEQLIAHAKTYANDSEEAGASVRLASVLWERSDGARAENLERACELLERALGILDRDPAARGSDIHLSALGSFGTVLGARLRGDQNANHARAIRVQREVLTLTSKRRNGRVWAMAQTNLGLALVEHGTSRSYATNDDEIDEAIRHFRQALRWRSFERDPNDWAHTQLNLGLAYIRRRRPSRRADLNRASKHFTEATRGFRAAANTPALALALGNRASTRLDLSLLGKSTKAPSRQLLDAAEKDARAAIALYDENACGVDAGLRWSQLGHVLMARNEYTPELVAAFRRALDDVTPESAPHDCRHTASRLGRMAASEGDWPVAAEAWEQAALSGAAVVDSRATRDGRFTEVAENLNVCRWAAYALTRAGNPTRAVEVLELGRARELATWLQREVVDLQSVSELDPQLCGRFVDLERQVAASERNRSPVDEVAAAHTAEQLRRVVDQIRKLPGLESFLKRPTINELVKGLQPGDSIAYPITAQGAMWLILRNDGRGRPDVEVVDVPGLTSMTAYAALAPLDGVTNGNGGDGFLTALGRDADTLDNAIAHVAFVLGPALLRPLSEALAARRCRSVCVVPVGLLSLVPLHALTWDEDGVERCLLDTVDVTYAPSAYVHAVCQARARRQHSFARLLAVGNPLPQHEPLPGAEREASLVHAIVPATEKVLLLGAAATRDAVVLALPDASHAHLACHGRAAVSDPSGFDAALSFAANAPVSAADILELDLSKTRLVTASACQTAVVPSYEGADEALSLSSLFLGAGAAGVVASLWSVDDYATSFLMARFYEELVATRENPAGALRRAQLWLRDLTQKEEAEYAARQASLCSAHAQRHGLPEPLAQGSAAIVAEPKLRPFARPSMWAAFTFAGA